jgi:hypothetical protein
MSPAVHQIISARGSKWKETLLAMFTVFIDDSGTDPHHPAAIAAALVVPASQIDALDNVWKGFLRSEFISEFHTAECVAGQRESDFESWSSQRKRHVCWRVREITKRFAVSAFSVAITKRDYDEFVTGELREFGGTFHYTWAVWSVLRNLERWALIKKVDSPFEFIFDWMGESKRNEAKREVESVMARNEAMKPGFYAGHFSFRKRKDNPALQCSDLVAWSCYQYARSVFYQSPMHPIAWESFWDYDDFNERTWMTALTQTRENLQKWVDLEGSDEIRKERRRNWVEQNKRKRPLPESP